jgi:hypothetical protein
MGDESEGRRKKPESREFDDGLSYESTPRSARRSAVPDVKAAVLLVPAGVAGTKDDLSCVEMTSKSGVSLSCNWAVAGKRVFIPDVTGQASGDVTSNLDSMVRSAQSIIIPKEQMVGATSDLQCLQISSVSGLALSCHWEGAGLKPENSSIAVEPQPAATAEPYMKPRARGLSGL